MILKLLLIIGVITAVYMMFFKKKPEVTRKETKKDPQAASEMVECAGCGVYVEIEEALLSESKYYCSKECLNAKA